MLHRFSDGCIDFRLGNTLEFRMPSGTRHDRSKSGRSGFATDVARAGRWIDHHDEHLLMTMKLATKECLQRMTARLGDLIDGTGDHGVHAITIPLASQGQKDRHLR